MEQEFKKNFSNQSSKKGDRESLIRNWINILPKSIEVSYKDKNLLVTGIDKSIYFIIGDIEQKNCIDYLCATYHPNAIINLAARAGVRASIKYPSLYVTTNTLGNLNLLEAAKNYNIDKYVLASTSSLYAGQQMPFDENLPVNEPISPYSSSKKGAEVMSYTYHYLYKINVTILRYFTVYGPAGRPDMSVLRFIKWIDEEVPIILYGDGSQTRDFTYINDISLGTIKSLALKDYQIINLGGGMKPITISSLITLIEKLLNKTAIIDQRPFQDSDLLSTQANNTKAKDLLNWNASCSFENGISSTINWYHQNISWLKDINI